MFKTVLYNQRSCKPLQKMPTSRYVVFRPSQNRNNNLELFQFSNQMAHFECQVVDFDTPIEQQLPGNFLLVYTLYHFVPLSCLCFFACVRSFTKCHRFTSPPAFTCISLDKKYTHHSISDGGFPCPSQQSVTLWPGIRILLSG